MKVLAAFVVACLRPCGAFMPNAHAPPLQVQHIPASTRALASVPSVGVASRAGVTCQRSSASDDDEPTDVFSKDKLLAETTAPFRKFRLFLYGGFGFSALIGGLTALTQTAATLANRPNALPLKDDLTNIGIDFVVVGLCAFAANFEWTAQKQLELATARMRKARQQEERFRIGDEVNADRVARMRDLQIKLNIDGKTQRDASVGSLMAEAQQDIAIVAGSLKVISDALLRATLVKDQVFSGRNLLVVPVVMVDDPTSAAGSDKGFGAPQKPAAYKQGFVAEPVNEPSWRDLLSEEMEDARRQGVEQPEKQGIVVVVRRDGAVVRRGVGAPRWELVRDDLTGVTTAAT